MYFVFSIIKRCPQNVQSDELNCLSNSQDSNLKWNRWTKKYRKTPHSEDLKKNGSHTAHTHCVATELVFLRNANKSRKWIDWWFELARIMFASMNFQESRWEYSLYEHFIICECEYEWKWKNREIILRKWFPTDWELVYEDHVDGIQLHQTSAPICMHHLFFPFASKVRNEYFYDVIAQKSFWKEDFIHFCSNSTTFYPLGLPHLFFDAACCYYPSTISHSFYATDNWLSAFSHWKWKYWTIKENYDRQELDESHVRHLLWSYFYYWTLNITVDLTQTLNWSLLNWNSLLFSFFFWDFLFYFRLSLTHLFFCFCFFHRQCAYGVPLKILWSIDYSQTVTWQSLYPYSVTWWHFPLNNISIYANKFRIRIEWRRKPIMCLCIEVLWLILISVRQANLIWVYWFFAIAQTQRVLPTIGIHLFKSLKFHKILRNNFIWRSRFALYWHQ